MRTTHSQRVQQHKRYTEMLLWIALALAGAIIWKCGSKITELETQLAQTQAKYDDMKLSVVKANEQADKEIRQYLKEGRR